MKKIISIVFFLLLALVPFGTLLRIKLTTNVYLLPQDLLVLILSSLLVLFFVQKKKLPQNFKPVQYLLLFILVGLTSALVNSFFLPNYNFFVALLYSTRYLLYIPLLFIGEVLQFNYKKWLSISGGVIIAFGIAQYLFYNNLGNLSYLGWDNHLYRLFSTFLDPNFAGAFYVIFFFFTFPQTIQALQERKRQAIPYALLSFFTLLSIFLTYSRTSFIMLLVGIIIFSLSIKKVKLLLLGCVASFIFLFLFSNVGIEGLNPFRTASSIERIKSAQGAVTIIQKQPIIGVGFNGYRYAQVHYGLRSVQGAKVSNADAGTDNSYLFVLATTGVIGFIFFLLGYFHLFKHTMKKRSFAYISARAILGASLVGCLFLNILFYTPILIWIYLIIGGLNREKVKA